MAEYDVDSYDSGVSYDEDIKPRERRKIMAKIKRDVKRASVPDRIAFGQQMVAACTGNPTFTGITADITALGTSTTALVAKMNAAQAAQSAAQQATVELNTEADDWSAKAETAFLAVEKIAHGDLATLLSANVPASEPGQGPAIGPLPEPANFSVTQGDLPATLDGSWDPVYGANGYVLQITTTADVSASWKQAAISTKSSCTLTGLATGRPISSASARLVRWAMARSPRKSRKSLRDRYLNGACSSGRPTTARCPPGQRAALFGGGKDPMATGRRLG